MFFKTYKILKLYNDGHFTELFANFTDKNFMANSLEIQNKLQFFIGW